MFHLKALEVYVVFFFSLATFSNSDHELREQKHECMIGTNNEIC